jgi:hypothetical protein
MFRLYAGILIGLGFSVVAGLLYFFVLGEPGNLFYPFAVLAFVVGPSVAGFFAARRQPMRKVRSFLTTGASVFGVVLVLFFVMYAIVPIFERTSVQLPDYCDGDYANPMPPDALAYALPDDRGTGIVVARDDQTSVVAVIAQDETPPTSQVYVVDEDRQQILWTASFPNDAVMAAISERIVYLYNDKLGYFLDANTGDYKDNVLVIDNYGGLSQTDRPILMGTSDGNWYVETSAVISSWEVNGTVHSRPFLILNAIANGCYVDGQTGVVTRL